MMQRGLIFAPVIGVIAGVAGIGLLLGWRAATTTETDVIDRIAVRYMGERGAEARRSDCRARPARSDGLWLVVICGAGAQEYTYFIDHYGRLADTSRPEPVTRDGERT